MPDPAQVDDPDRAQQMQGALDYMGLTPRQKLTDIRVDRVFIGSCTNARIEDLRAAAAVLAGRKAKVPGIVSPGSTLVKHQAEQEGLDKVFVDGGPHLGGERLLDVPRHQRRHRAAGRALRLDHQPQLPRPAGAGRAHPPDVARDGGGRRGDRPPRRRAADARREGVMEQFKMQPFRKLDGVAVALRRDNVDTDQVIPARYLKVSRAEGLGDTLFRDLRFDANGKPRPDFPLNDPARKGASVLIGRQEFRRRLLARGGGLCAGRLRHPLRGRDQLRRHLRRQLR